MNELNRVFLDTTPVIYYVQRNEMYFEKVKSIFAFMNEKGAKFVSSDITTAEACVYPYRLDKTEWLNDLYRFINEFYVEIIHTSDEIARMTARIRARYQTFKTMDAIQLATAVVGDCDVFLTNDKRLRQFDGVRCLTIGDFVIE